MASSRLYFLGSPHFVLDDAPVVFSSAKAAALLAYLSAARTPQPRERLMALLWPDSLEESARKNLRNTLWIIRRSLGENTLNGDAALLSLGDDVWVDSRQFEHLFTAAPSDSDLQPVVELYGGPFLDGFSLHDAPDFELWATGERERLDQLYLRALALLVEQYRQQADWQAVIATAQRALAYDSLQEAMHRLLMEAYVHLGQRPEALRQYETLRSLFARELGVEPLPETQALHSAILNGEIQAVQPATAMAPAHPPSLPPGPVIPFIGRQPERASLDEELKIALAGFTRVVLITGEAGIGKSRLWQEWSATLPSTLEVLETRCLDVTQSLPFAPLTDLFSRPACMSHLTTLQISPIWLAEVARLLPEIRTVLPNLPPPATLPAEEERRRVFEAFTQFLSPPDARPLILFIDDLHWADQTTLDWLAYVVNRLRDRKLLFVATYRPEEAPAPLIRHVSSWGRQGILKRLPLSRLTVEESALLLTALGGDPVLVDRVQTQSAGNPYFLIELARTEGDVVPPALTELIGARLARLPESVQQVLQAAAVLDSDFTFDMLRSMSGRGEEDTLDALDVMLNGSVLVERGTLYAFAHPLVAAVVQDGLSAARRAFLHRRAAEALQSAFANRIEPVAGQLSAHYEQAGDPVQAAHFAEIAARHALTLAASAEALELYRRALELDPTPARHMGIGDVLYRMGDLGPAREAYRAALDGFIAQNDRQGQTRAALNLASTYVPAGSAADVTDWVNRGVETLDAQADPASHALAHFLIGAALLVTEQPLEAAETHLAESIQLATENNLKDMAARARFEMGNLFAQRGDLPSALREYRESITLAQAAGDPFQEVLGHNNLAYHALLADDLATAHEQIEIGLSMAETGELRLPLQYVYSTRGELALADSQWDDAEIWFNRALAEAEHNGNLKQMANLRANLGLALRGRGDLDGAVMMLESARETTESATWPHLQSQIDLWLTELYLERGERVAAGEALDRAEARLSGAKRERLEAWAQRLRALQNVAAR